MRGQLFEIEQFADGHAPSAQEDFVTGPFFLRGWRIISNNTVYVHRETMT